VFKAVDRFAGGVRFPDDLTVIVVKS